MSTGQRIAQLRKARGLTQAALAQRAGVSASAIAMYETNRRTPDATALARIATVLGVSPEELAADPVQTSAKTAAAAESPAETPPASEPAASSAAAGTADPRTFTTLALTRDEARIILFLRLHPDLLPFFQSFVTAEPRRRRQLLRTWELIHQFQS